MVLFGNKVKNLITKIINQKNEDNHLDKTVEIIHCWQILDFLNQSGISVNKEGYIGKNIYAKQVIVHTVDELYNRIKVSEKGVLEKTGNKYKLQHMTFYIGRSKRQECIRFLADSLGYKNLDEIEPNGEYLPWITFQVNNQGVYIEKSFSISPVLWALHQSHKDDSIERLSSELTNETYNAFINGTNSEFPTEELFCQISKTIQNESYENDYLIQYDELLNKFEKITILEEKALTLWGLYIKDWLKRFRQFLPNGVSLVEAANNLNKTPYVMAECEFHPIENKKIHKLNTYGLSKSFFADDLKMVADAMNVNPTYFSHGIGKVLHEFIISPLLIDKKRFDVVDKNNKEKDNILSELMEPLYYPKGKWISKYSPALMQQVAINMASFNADMNKAEKKYWGINGPVFSVNGPPGTGKTTLLKEIIVNNIVNRAKLLAQYNKPDEAFKEYVSIDGVESSDHYSGQAKHVSRYFKFIEDRINQYGILVASSNNAAVENITKELPDLKQLNDAPKVIQQSLGYKKGEALPKNIYFTPEANALLMQTADVTLNNGTSAWALISAPLGKKENISNLCKFVLEPICQQIECGSGKTEFDFLACKTEFLTWEKKVLALRDELEKKSKAYPIYNISEQQESEPWKNLDFDIARELLFLSALKLTMAFIIHSHSLLHNLKTLNDYWQTRNVPADNKNTVFPVLLQSLFLVVPVLSTTFASVQTFLKNIKEPGKLGTLVVDEAGQAQPYMAVGALYRCRSAVIVGDPKQVEPVVTEDLNILRKVLFKQIFAKSTGHKDIEYRDTTASVQSFADTLNQVGTYVGTQESRLWVGSPLRVHRRCVSPMFDVSNELSYSGFMINSTRSDFDELFPETSKSAWYDIGGKATRNQFVEEQGEVAVSIVKSYIQLKNSIKEHNKTHPNENKKEPTLYIISPFKAVAKEIEKEVKKIDPNKYMKDAIGTVHTFQGKEADIVVFVLGCDKSQEGAVQWVNANIVNVAVTRAKNRLYVIGDVSLWKANPNLNTLLGILEKGDYPIQKEIAPLFTQEEPLQKVINIVDGRTQYRCDRYNGKSLGPDDVIYYEEKDGKPLIYMCAKCHDYPYQLIDGKGAVLPHWSCKKCHDKQLLRKNVPDFYKKYFK